MTNFVDKVEALKKRYILLFVMATLTAVGQSTKPAPDPPLCLMKKGDYYVACP